MIPVKEAVASAFAHIKDVFGTNLPGLQLEEVERVGNRWRITVSFLQEDVPIPIPVPKYHRVYKEIAVDGATGACDSIKIRQLQ